MDPNSSQAHENYISPSEYAENINYYCQEIARKNYTIHTLCTDIIGHINANNQLENQNALLLQKSTETNTENTQLHSELSKFKETVAELKEENERLIKYDKEIRAANSKLVQENTAYHSAEEEIRDSYNRLQAENQRMWRKLNRTQHQLETARRTAHYYMERTQELGGDPNVEEEEEEEQPVHSEEDSVHL